MTKKKDFELVLKHGQWFKSSNFSLKLRKNSQISKLLNKINDLDKTNTWLKIAISVGLKYSKKAVERNRLKRQILEIVRDAEKAKMIGTEGLVLIVPNTTADKLSKISFADLSKEIKLLFIKAGLSEK